MLDLVSWLDEDLIKLLTPQLLQNAPNTYSYTKCLTEQLVTEYSKKIPASIARPSIGILHFSLNNKYKNVFDGFMH